MFSISDSVKKSLRSLLPGQYQVPLKYYYNLSQSSLEPEMQLLPYLVNKHDRVIDIGGNRGVYSYKLWALGADIEVFEPNSRCSDVLAAWASGKPEVNVHSVALSSKSGVANLHVPIDEYGIEHDASGSIESHEFGRSLEDEVKLMTLDEFSFERVSLIKIDVEGHEYSVIEGADKTLRSMQPSILVEIEQRHIDRPITEVFNKILAYGYSGYYLSEGKLVSIDCFDLARDQMISSAENLSNKYVNNFLFLHVSRLDKLKENGLFD